MTIEVHKAASRSTDPRIAARELHATLGANAALTIFYCAPTYDLDQLGAAICELWGSDAPVIGCTTAGEITPFGYLEGTLTGVSLGGPGVVAHTEVVHQLRDAKIAAGGDIAAAALAGFEARGGEPSEATCFGFLISDGLAMQEEVLATMLYTKLGGIQMFGGSAGDGLRFASTHLYHGGRFHTDAALFTLIGVPAPFRVFKTDHFTSSPQKLVVTGAEPARRIVTEINGEPAAREYARMVGLDVEHLTPMIFAAHPVVVSIGGMTYIRSIQKVNEDESLSFFCAIDEGIVLRVAQPTDLIANLKAMFADLRTQVGEPAIVLGCDCILRFLEIQQRGLADEVSQIFTANNVIGFATYGEQYNMMHVNQTFTGVAIGNR